MQVTPSTTITPSDWYTTILNTETVSRGKVEPMALKDVQNLSFIPGVGGSPWQADIFCVAGIHFYNIVSMFSKYSLCLI